MKTQAEADTFVATVDLPTGYRIEVRPVRTFKWRSLWALYLYHGAAIVKAWSAYELEPACRMAADHARREAGIDPNAGLVVTTDGQGWVTSITDA